MNNAVFGNTMENVRKHKGFKLVTTERKKNHLVLETTYHGTKVFTENVSALEIKIVIWKQRY